VLNKCEKLPNPTSTQNLQRHNFKRWLSFYCLRTPWEKTTVITTKPLDIWWPLLPSNNRFQIDIAWGRLPQNLQSHKNMNLFIRFTCNFQILMPKKTKYESSHPISCFLNSILMPGSWKRKAYNAKQKITLMIHVHSTNINLSIYDIFTSTIQFNHPFGNIINKLHNLKQIKLKVSKAMKTSVLPYPN